MSLSSGIVDSYPHSPQDFRNQPGSAIVAWQDRESRSWFPVGRLTANEARYQFVYTRGAEEAQRECHFQPLEPFRSLTDVYESDELFPLFSNRLLSRDRPDYDLFVEWLNVPRHGDDPIALLARSGGRRETDTFEVFPCPEPDQAGLYHTHFFSHGLRHVSHDSINRIAQLQPGEPLRLFHDFQNRYDSGALGLRTDDSFHGDRYFVGYCPRYLQEDFFEVLQSCPEPPTVAVERVNLPPAPLQFRLLCNMTACWPEGFRPCSGERYQPLVAGVATGW